MQRDDGQQYAELYLVHGCETIHENLSGLCQKDRKFYRVGVASCVSKRPRILAAIPDVGEGALHHP